MSEKITAVFGLSLRAQDKEHPMLDRRSDTFEFPAGTHDYEIRDAYLVWVQKQLVRSVSVVESPTRSRELRLPFITV